MLIQPESNKRQFGSRADALRLCETDHVNHEPSLEEDATQVYCPSQARIKRMCRIIRSTWSERNYIKRSGCKPLRWLVSTVTVNPGATESSDE